MEQELSTLPDDIGSPLVFIEISIDRFVQLQVFIILASCCGDRYDFRLKHYIHFVFTPLLFML